MPLILKRPLSEHRNNRKSGEFMLAKVIVIIFLIDAKLLCDKVG